MVPVLIVGCGDLGLRVARLLLARGTPVHGVVRSPARAEALRAQGLHAHVVDLDAAADLPAAERVYWFAPPPASGHTDPRLAHALDRLAQPPRRLVYVSTSGVYGDCGGRWIDEDEPLKPQSDRGRRRLDAEQRLAASAIPEVVVLRVPGIYGPGRLPLERLRRGVPVIADDQSPWTNRIHADDLAQAAVAAMERGRPGAAYNVSDGRPSTMTDYFSRCARLLGLPEPRRIPLAQAADTLGPALMSFLDESKRLINRRLCEELGVVLRYPDLDHGLPACLDPPVPAPITPG